MSVSGSNDTTVSVAQGTRNSNNSRPTGSKNTIGGTYIQNGLYQTYEEFTGMTDKGVVQSGTQAGTQRTPIMILMSDGAPTAATTDYYEVGTSNTGNGGSTNDRITFLTQLTAAWVKGSVSAHYNNTAAKFYTVGLGTANDVNATAVLYPAGSNNTLRGYWTNFNNGSEDGNSVAIIQGSNRPGPGGNQPGWSLIYKAVAETVGRNYVDSYWSASNSGDMIEAFQEIVDEIGLQSAYSATLVESGEADLDGYITVEDELGSMMQVKDIKGILLGDKLFTGAELAKSMQEGLLGQSSNPKEYGNVFVQTVKTRIGIEDTSVAQNLIRSAYHSGQLSYTSDTEYSNYIGWYGDENNGYLGFWNADSGMTGEGAPDGTKYINQSYGYLGGTAENAATEGAADMMHIVVMVRTEIATGHQTVLFKVPSSLIPMVTYTVELEGEAMTEGTSAKLAVEENNPIRLLYEVGLPDDVNSVNLEQKVQEYLDKEGSNHIHKNGDGSYIFYANSWGAVNEEAPDISELTDAEKQTLTASVAESHFIPNTANERFYILEDALVYDSNHNPVTAISSNGTYYFARPIVTATGANGAAEVQIQYEQLSAATVANAANFQTNADGYMEVKAGTIRQHLSNLELEKSENATDTIGYSDSLWVYVPGSDADDYNVYSFLGNNGKLSVAPATGLKVTKNVTEYAEGDGADTKFAITVTLSQAEEAAVVTDANGNPLPAGTWSTTDNQVFTLNLAHGETVYITGLTAGTTYNVAEYDEDYTTAYIGENGTVVAGAVQEASVINGALKEGSLYITKEVVPYQDGEPFPTDYEFKFQVTFVDKNGNPIANTTFQLENNYQPELTELTTDANGVMTGKLRHGETVYIQGIPAGAVVTVEEVNLPQDGSYTLSGYRSRNHSGDTVDTDGVVTIVSEANATVVVTNTYTPKSTTVDLDINGTKNFVVEGNQAAQQAGSFTFVVEQWNGQAWAVMDSKTVTLDYPAGEGSSQKTFTIENALENVTYDKAGVYTYQVREVIGTVENVTYDRTLYTFTVTVTDVNGQLTAKVTDLKNAEITDGSYEVEFNNSLYNAPVSIDIEKTVDNKSGDPSVSKAGFAFVAQEAQVNEGVWSVKEGGSALTVYSDGQGEARVTATYREPGTFYYLLSEAVPEGAVLNAETGKYELNGWVYDSAQHKVIVTVQKEIVDGNETDNLVAAMDIDGTAYGDNATVTFTNTYDPKDVQVDLKTKPVLNKILTGRDLKEGEFTFAIFEDGKSSHTSTDGAVAQGSNSALVDGVSTVAFEPALTFDKVGKYEFDVVEILPAGAVLDEATGKYTYNGVAYNLTILDLVVEVSLDKQTGKLVAKHYFEDAVDDAVFKNTYTVKPTEVVIDGLKSIQVNSGLKELIAGEFAFGLYENDVKIAETTNLANGTFKFDAIAYNGDDIGKTYTYVVKEIAPDGTTDGSYSANGMQWSGKSFAVTVKITDNGDGTISAEAAGNGANTIKFVNEYTSKPVSVSLPGKKNLEGRGLTEGEFLFELYTADANFENRTLVKGDITHGADGNFNISLGTLGMGYHYFVVKEVIPDNRAAGIGYDASEYHITVQVTDNGTGKMDKVVAVHHTGDPNAVNPDIVFNNLYRPEDGELSLGGSKTYNGGKALTDDVFYVGLYEGTTELQRVPVKADGSFTFAALEYTADHIGTYTYTVKEILPQGAIDNGDGTFTSGSDIYDGTVYTVVVTVADENKDGTLEITKTVNGIADGAISFTNTFVPTPIQHQLVAEKTYEKGLKGGDFEFTLVSTDGKTNVNQPVKNDAAGKVEFAPIEFTAAGDYKFEVKEKKEGILSFIRPSEAEYEVTITVVNENGVLRVSNVAVVKTKGADNENNLTFVNEYIMDGEGEVTLRGTKTLTGDRTTVNNEEFEFGLYDAEGNLIERVKNDASGNFQFATLKFDEEDTVMNGEKQYTYTVKEIAGNDPYVTYDEAIYNVVVTVKDDDEGGIAVAYTVNGTPNGRIAFKNTFTNPDPVSVIIDITKTVENKTQPGITAEDFEILLYEGDVQRGTAKTGATGKAGFQITYGLEDVGKTVTYKVMEKKGKVAGVTYDETVYAVKVAVAAKEDGTLYTVINDKEADSVAVSFKNIYEKPATPVTGDEFPVFLAGGLLLISAAAFIVLLLTKKKGGKYAG